MLSMILLEKNMQTDIIFHELTRWQLHCPHLFKCLCNVQLYLHIN